ncbi:myosin light chain 1 [Zygosaccharomyces mellis]|uniref:Myosin light chain 1 n=1 Tax=Zygosaccharomyces mellis TaxID=42258 RepID=A0A4C2EA87_9SACH|nr:myosin light chain 1 [Zygosaccharomyces mellis]
MSTAAARTNKDIFTLFDKKGQGTIPKPLFGDYLRAIGYNPTIQQTEQILADGNAPDQLSLDSIHELIQRNQQELEATTSGRVEDFIKAFQVFDKENTGKVSVGDVRYMLTSLGEKLSDEEVNELLKGVEIDSDGGVNYKKFIEDILRQ